MFAFRASGTGALRAGTRWPADMQIFRRFRRRASIR